MNHPFRGLWHWIRIDLRIEQKVNNKFENIDLVASYGVYMFYL